MSSDGDLILRGTIRKAFDAKVGTFGYSDIAALPAAVPVPETALREVREILVDREKLESELVRSKTVLVDPVDSKIDTNKLRAFADEQLSSADVSSDEGCPICGAQGLHGCSGWSTIAKAALDLAEEYRRFRKLSPPPIGHVRNDLDAALERYIAAKEKA